MSKMSKNPEKTGKRSKKIQNSLKREKNVKM